MIGLSATVASLLLVLQTWLWGHWIPWVFSFLYMKVENYHLHTIYNRLHTVALSQWSWCVPELKIDWLLATAASLLLVLQTWVWCAGFLGSSASSIRNFVVLDYLYKTKLCSIKLVQLVCPSAQSGPGGHHLQDLVHETTKY